MVNYEEKLWNNYTFGLVLDFCVSFTLPSIGGQVGGTKSRGKKSNLINIIS